MDVLAPAHIIGSRRIPVLPPFYPAVPYSLGNLHLLLVLGSLLALPAAPCLAAAEPPVSFNEHIRLLSDNCFACHGADAAHRKGKLPLDQADSATADRRGIRAFAPGDLRNSNAWDRIVSTDPDDVMPPPDSHKPPLTAAQRALIKRWIEQGAVYQNHWAYEPVSTPALPAISPSASGSTHPVDRFIAAKLAAQPSRLKLAAEAPPEVLLRRLTLISPAYRPRPPSSMPSSPTAPPLLQRPPLQLQLAAKRR